MNWAHQYVEDSAMTARSRQLSALGGVGFTVSRSVRMRWDPPPREPILDDEPEECKRRHKKNEVPPGPESRVVHERPSFLWLLCSAKYVPLGTATRSTLGNSENYRRVPASHHDSLRERMTHCAREARDLITTGCREYATNLGCSCCACSLAAIACPMWQKYQKANK